MTTIQIMTSIPIELGIFLEEHSEISPSKVLQSRLFEIKEQKAQEDIRFKVMESKMQTILRKFESLSQFLCDKNQSSLLEEWSNQK